MPPMNFNFSASSNSNNRRQGGNKLTPQDEYWLDRILRNHSTQIFIVVVLFISLIIAIVVSSILNPSRTENSGAYSQKIEINGSKIIITQ